MLDRADPRSHAQKRHEKILCLHRVVGQVMVEALVVFRLDDVFDVEFG